MDNVGITLLGEFKTVQHRVRITRHLATTDGIVAQTHTIVTLVPCLAGS